MRAGMATRRMPLLTLAGLLVAVLAALSALFMARAQARSNGWIQHSLMVKVSVGRVLDAVRAVESERRGYLLTHNPTMRDNAIRAENSLAPFLSALIRQVRDNPVQVENAHRLKKAVEARIAYTKIKPPEILTRRLIVAPGQAAKAVRLMDDVLTRIRIMTEAEDQILAERRRTTNRIIVGTGILLLLTVLLVLVTAAVVLRDARRREAELTRARDGALAAEGALREQMAAREQAEAQVRQMQKMDSIGQLTGGIAHDFNNMLAIVIGSLDLARRRIDEGDRERLERCIANAHEGAERAAALTARLLAFSRQQPLAPLVLDVNKLVAGMSELMRRTLGEQYLVETVLAGGLWRTFVDPSQLENAILNLVVNARDAMPRGGHVTIETANAYLDDEYARTCGEVLPGQYVMLSVSDSGDGMTPDVIEKAFDPFFTTKAIGKGTGLGLSQIFGFMKQSGGHAAIYSEPGQGSTVKLYLPRNHGEAVDPRSRETGEIVVPRACPGEVILVVEDEQRVRHFSVDALRELGYAVISAANGTEALQGLSEQPEITMLFTDVVMPEMNGRALADAALAMRPDLKILFTTGYTRNAVVHNGMLDAGVAFLPKPFSITQLAVKVREVLDGSGANRPVSAAVDSGTPRG